MSTTIEPRTTIQYRLTQTERQRFAGFLEGQDAPMMFAAGFAAAIALELSPPDPDAYPQLLAECEQLCREAEAAAEERLEDDPEALELRTHFSGHETYAILDTAIRRATRSDEHASLAGLPAFALLDLRRAVTEAAYDIDKMIAHEHQWGPDDYCNHCGSDGRA